MCFVVEVSSLFIRVLYNIELYISMIYICKCIFPFHISWVTERNCKVNGNLKTFTQKTSAGKHVKVVDLCNCIAMENLMIFSSIELHNKTLNVARAKNTISLNASLNLFRCDVNTITDCRLQVALHVMLATIRRTKECSRTSPSLRVACPTAWESGFIYNLRVCFAFLFVWHALLLC